MLRKTFSLLTTAGLLVSYATGIAQTASSDNEGQIRAIVQSEADAWNRGDAEAFAAHYAENGSFTNVIGEQLYGRPAFVKQHQLIFSTFYKDSHNTFSIGKSCLYGLTSPLWTSTVA